MTDRTTVPTISRSEKSSYGVPHFLRSRRALMLAAALVAGIGLATNWNWLVAAGIAPILIAMLPCLVMCGLGLCMHRMTGGSCENRAAGKDGEPK